MHKRHYQKVSQSPTKPLKPHSPLGPSELMPGMALDEKLRQAYFWIVNHAIISPYYDIAYFESPQKIPLSPGLNLPTAQSYSSFVLLPLLNFAVRRKCLLIGGPGRGKTASATLMGVLAGYPVQEVKRAIQHGQPQMTITDLVGNPLPSYLMGAKNMDEIKISWRKWLGMRVKIIDEYNRIPTRTQSALLTLMGDNYAEVLDQIYECPESAWYLTANAETEDGTYEVIDALRDRIDIVVKTLHFSPSFLDELILRIENRIRPEEVVPPEIIFTAEEMDTIYQGILEIDIPRPIQKRIEFFASQFEFYDKAGQQFEYKTKDNLRLASRKQHAFSHPHDVMDLGSQTLNGLSVRALLTLILFCKALAYFRGAQVVQLEDVRQILPFVLHDKLQQNPRAPFFTEEAHQVYLTDRISWLRLMFDLSCESYDQRNLDAQDPVAELSEEFDMGLENVSEAQVEARLAKIEVLLVDFQSQAPFRGPTYESIIKLKYLHQRYINYLNWLRWKN